MFKSALHRHGRFLISFAFGVVLWALCLQTSLNFFTRALVGVNGFFVAYVLLMFHLIRQASAEDLRRHSEEDDEGAGLIVFLAILAVGVSLTSIFLVLNRPSIKVTEALFALSAAPFGWAMIHMLAAFRYAHLYYAPEPDCGLDFPGGTKSPTISDFLYFAFTIGMTAQVSDIVVTTAPMRKTVLLHSIGSFFFNTVILALAVNAAIALSNGV
jgi:uncharacterized membrane protein